MITLIANAETNTKVTRKSISYKDALLLCEGVDEKINQLSNCNNGFQVRLGNGGVNALVRDWVAYKLSGFNKECIDFTHYWFH